MSATLEGRSAIVTGAGSGINFAFARLLLERGVNVLFADLSLRPEAEAVVQQYSSKNEKARAVFQKTDVTDWSQLSCMFEVAVREFGEVDIVIPGAGVYEPAFSNFWSPPGSPASKDSPDGGRYLTLDINLTHPIRTTQLAISHFLSQPATSKSYPKSIVHISSQAGQKPGFATPMYVATKHAINGFVRSLDRLDQEHGIRVTACAPGVIYTPLWFDNPDKLKGVSNDDVWVMPEEVAEVMLALAVEDSIHQTPDASSSSIDIRGGTILEVTKGKVRDVQPYNDPGPGTGAGTTTTSYGKVMDDALAKLQERDWGKF